MTGGMDAVGGAHARGLREFGAPECLVHGNKRGVRFRRNGMYFVEVGFHHFVWGCVGFFADGRRLADEEVACGEMSACEAQQAPVCRGKFIQGHGFGIGQILNVTPDVIDTDTDTETIGFERKDIGMPPLF